MEGSLLGAPHVFERGDKIYLTTPLTLATPTAQQVEEYAFSSAVKSSAPNEHIGWLQGRYVEAGKANLNNAMWLNNELAMKSLTPMLMPVTVMHDPRTAVGTIADCKLVAPEVAATSTSRIDTILAVWRHRFPDIWEEAEDNRQKGTLMQSMECLSPSYTCGECGKQFVKLYQGKEQASWCDHLRNNSSPRILQDVCFTGTGLIFGSRGGRGAYTDAHLDHFQDEIAEFHDKAHVDSTYRPSERSTPVGLVQIEETELANLRKERDDAKKTADEQATQNRDLATKVEKAEAEVASEKARADKEEKARKDLEEKAQAVTLKETRLGTLGTGFTAKLGEFTRERLGELASTLSDEEWESALKEREELAKVKRDAKGEEVAADGTTTTTPADGVTPPAAAGTSFSSEELANFNRSGITSPAPAGAGAGAPNASRQLARAFRPKPKVAEPAAK
jgi:hypothetical protein